MASVSVSSLVIFIASLLVAASVAGTLVTQVDDITSTVTRSSADVEENINTDVAIISDTGRPESIYNGSQPVDILVKNTGSKTLAADAGQLDVLIDGNYVPESDMDVVTAGTGSGTWAPGEVVKVKLYRDLSNGDHRVRVIVNGNKDTIGFRT
jgi:flagellar protein FlaG